MWNHRVFEISSGDEVNKSYLEIREVYYDEEGGIAFIGDGAAGVTWFPEFGEGWLSTIELLRTALDKPVLNLDEVEKGLDERGTQEMD